MEGSTVYGSLRCWSGEGCFSQVLQPKGFSQKSAEVEALSSGGSFAVELGRVYVLHYNKVHGHQNYAMATLVQRKGRKSGMLCT